MAIELTIPAEQTPCFDTDPDTRRELTALFSSTAVLDHLDARELCSECPFRRQCFDLAAATRKQLGWAGVPEGTWGGVLWIKGKPQQPRGRASKQLELAGMPA